MRVCGLSGSGVATEWQHSGAVMKPDDRALEALLARLEIDRSLTFRCLYCGWSTTAPLEEGRRQFAAHPCPGRSEGLGRALTASR
jgi:hypothetical protein